MKEACVQANKNTSEQMTNRTNDREGKEQKGEGEGH